MDKIFITCHNSPDRLNAPCENETKTFDPKAEAIDISEEYNDSRWISRSAWNLNMPNTLGPVAAHWIKNGTLIVAVKTIIAQANLIKRREA